MNSIEIKCELQEIAKIISVYEMKVNNYENNNRYIKLVERQSELFDMLTVANSLEGKNSKLFIQGF